jgi:hypothetical protein
LVSKRATLSIVQPYVSKDLVDTLEYLLQEAKSGNLIGIAYGAMLPGRKYFVDAAGEAHRDPLRGIGLAQYVSQEIAARHMGIK